MAHTTLRSAATGQVAVRVSPLLHDRWLRLAEELGQPFADLLREMLTLGEAEVRRRAAAGKPPPAPDQLPAGWPDTPARRCLDEATAALAGLVQDPQRLRGSVINAIDLGPGERPRQVLLSLYELADRPRVMVAYANVALAALDEMDREVGLMQLHGLLAASSEFERMRRDVADQAEEARRHAG